MIKMNGLDALTKQFELLVSDDKKFFTMMLEEMGVTFLALVEEELKSHQKADTEILLQSFKRGHENNVWELEGLRLEVGTDLEYSSYVNDGHWQEQRFVPGTWQDGLFVYDPSASTGMMLKAEFVEGSHYWDLALLAFESMFEKKLDTLMQEWLDKM